MYHRPPRRSTVRLSVHVGVEPDQEPVNVLAVVEDKRGVALVLVQARPQVAHIIAPLACQALHSGPSEAGAGGLTPH